MKRRDISSNERGVFQVTLRTGRITGGENARCKTPEGRTDQNPTSPSKEETTERPISE